MTTLRRVLLQSAKEAGPIDTAAPTVSSAPEKKAATPHPSGKHTPRKPSPSLSADEEDGEQERKLPLSKKRRSSKGWEDTGKESDLASLKSPKLTKETSSDSSSRSPRSTKSTTSTPAPRSPRNASEKPNAPVTTASSAAVSNTSATAPAPPPPAIQLPPSASTRTKSPSPPQRASRTPSPPARDPKDVKENQQKGEATNQNILKETLSRQSSSSGSSSSTGKHQASTTGAKPKMSTVIAQEWVQCEACKKWRKLPLSISASSLPDTWVCEMNTWNAAMANCNASVEEGSEETTNEDGNNSGSNDGNATGAVNGGGATTAKRATLPPGINLYGGQVQVPQVTVGPNGQKLPRLVTYRDLIGAHYRYNKNFNTGFNSTCDARFAPFSAYMSPSTNPRPSQASFHALAMLTACTSPSDVSSSSSSPSANENMVNGTSSVPKKVLTPDACLPPKKKLRFLNQTTS